MSIIDDDIISNLSNNETFGSSVESVGELWFG